MSNGEEMLTKGVWVSVAVVPRGRDAKVSRNQSDRRAALLGMSGVGMAKLVRCAVHETCATRWGLGAIW
jgi:hypothetical protein